MFGPPSSGGIFGPGGNLVGPGSGLFGQPGSSYIDPALGRMGGGQPDWYGNDPNDMFPRGPPGFGGPSGGFGGPSGGSGNPFGGGGNWYS
mmetsp:Transcript_47300/g.34591  ORF Transcript_47300/g.34591 Transcript_47300/m.34591 type:complete len:90 (+) Transcript_47300:599-868(+)|eukprot:CAMPEP_0202962856 /NCGR_PEP_ID=MMETSP1396-20130829/6902_1 /ASSEMBLY_ACC=CAM_ASM_000872 /TAXON_ID= /ORGANISM="Pseudokeronopsis sp., Strain Brazil" /LENGTH=89 /DNA_ID=CAMNT_0049683671 /DNA_START=592 /DNA_END=861 /DNA_ORIENTATION=-